MIGLKSSTAVIWLMFVYFVGINFPCILLVPGMIIYEVLCSYMMFKV